MSDLESSVSRIQAAYAAAVHAKDAIAFVQLYEPDARVFDAWGVWQYRGAEDWQRCIEGWFNSLGTERVRVSFQDTVVHGTAEGAFVSAFVTYAGLSETGEQLRSLDNRITWGLRERGHALRICHEHTSAPIGFEDMKALLDRKAP